MEELKPCLCPKSEAKTVKRITSQIWQCHRCGGVGSISEPEVSVPTKGKILGVLMDSNFYGKIYYFCRTEDFSKDVEEFVNNLYALFTYNQSISYDIIEDLRLEVIACLDSRDQNYIDDLFKKAMNSLKTSGKDKQ